MANTYTQIHIQTVFAVQNRASLIKREWEVELYKYIVGIIQNYNHKVLAINGMPDHIHILIGFRPTQSLSDLMQKVKQDSSKWINKRRLLPNKFSWQAGYGAFSYSKSSVPNVVRYIQNQKEHHKRYSFIDEYTKTLKELKIDYNDNYIFHSVND